MFNLWLTTCVRDRGTVRVLRENDDDQKIKIKIKKNCNQVQKTGLQMGKPVLIRFFEGSSIRQENDNCSLCRT